MKVSVVVRARDEYPVVLGTLHSLLDDLEHGGYEPELLVVCNRSTDVTADVLEDRFRRWVRCGLLRILRLDDVESTWQAANAGIKAASAEFVAVADAHISLKTGTMRALVEGCRERGGIWHAPVNKWGDVDRIRTYGYDLTLTHNFWGNPCLYLPKGVEVDESGTKKPYKVPMMGACLLVLRRDELERFGAYHPALGIYGGGEPYLDLKWWMLGSAVWCAPDALCRHAFGWRASWARAERERLAKRDVYRRDGKFVRKLNPGDEWLTYSKGYRRTDVQMYRNFMLAAYVLGDERWLRHVCGRFELKLPGAIDKLRSIAREVQREGEEERRWLGKNGFSLGQLLANPPWLSCDRHPREDYGVLAP